MEQTEQPSFDCICRKCGSNFISKFEADLDNDGLCGDCKTKTENLAKIIQKRIDQMRANRPPVIKREPQTMPGTSYINSRDLLL